MKEVRTFQNSPLVLISTIAGCSSGGDNWEQVFDEKQCNSLFNEKATAENIAWEIKASLPELSLY